jgi:hypothetical protein
LWQTISPAAFAQSAGTSTSRGCRRTRLANRLLAWNGISSEALSGAARFGAHEGCSAYNAGGELLDAILCERVDQDGGL